MELNKKLVFTCFYREAFTLNLLSIFRSKLQSLSEAPLHGGEKHDHTVAKDVEKDIITEMWFTHTFRFENATILVVAKDASSKGDDWYDVTDPRNPINKRKRCAEKRKKKIIIFVFIKILQNFHTYFFILSLISTIKINL